MIITLNDRRRPVESLPVIANLYSLPVSLKHWAGRLI